MAPASGFLSTGGRRSGAGAAPVFSGFRLPASGFRQIILIALVACGSVERAPDRAPPAPPIHPAAADPAAGITTDLDGAAPELDDGLLAELTGDPDAARGAYEKVLAAPETPSPVQARAALHLARLEARAGKSGRALDLGARAAALAPNDLTITEGIAQLRGDVVAASGAGDVHPPIGTALPGVPTRIADRFAAAERVLEFLHRRQPRPIELLLGDREDATVGLVARYHELESAGGLAQIAASYRIGTLYHDLALALLFELQEGNIVAKLEPAVAAGVRRTLRGRALFYLKRAAAAYHTSLAGPESGDAELWRLAAEEGEHAAQAVLREAGEGEGSGT
jgi:hypothetical protein